MPVSRVEIADHVRDAFVAGPASLEAVMAAAATSGARREVLDVLERLPDRTYQELRHLWGDLGGIPIELDETGAQ
jgi:hypothetical protein